MRTLLLLGCVGCVEGRGHVDVASRVDVSARDRAQIETHCFQDTPCGEVTLEVTIDGVATRIADRRGEVAMSPGAQTITVAWSDGFDTASATTAIPQPIAIVRPAPGAIVERPGSIDLAWDVESGVDFEAAVDARCEGVARGITYRFARPDPTLRSGSIDLAYFDVLPPVDCLGLLAVANVAEARGVTEETTLFLRTQDVDRIDFTLRATRSR